MSSLSPDAILKQTQEAMVKPLEYLKKEMRGMRTGRASPAIIEFVKVDYYGQSQDLKNLAVISVTEATQLLVKPFDAASLQEIKRAIESAGLGLNPMPEGKQLRVNLPSLTGDRRKQLVGHCKKMGEETKVALRNGRRDGNKAADTLKNDPKAHVPEDEIEQLKTEINDLLKKYEKETDDLIAAKSKEIETI